MPGYFIANFTIQDREKFNQYWATTPKLADFGGRALVQAGNPTVLKGEPHQVIAIIEFESVEAAQAWYQSPEYQQALPLWLEAVDGWSLIAGDIGGLAGINPTPS